MIIVSGFLTFERKLVLLAATRKEYMQQVLGRGHIKEENTSYKQQEVWREHLKNTWKIMSKLCNINKSVTKSKNKKDANNIDRSQDC